MDQALKYVDIYQDLKSKIHSGILAPGLKLPSQRNMMEQYQVSFATITSALNELSNDGLIKREPRRGIFVKDSLPKEKVVIGYFMTESIINPSGHLKGVFDQVNESGVSLEMVLFDGEADRRKKCKDIIAGKTNINACLFQHLPGYNDVVEYCNEANFPYMVLDVPSYDDSFNQVLVDNKKISHEVVSHLIRHGHKQIALLGIDCQNTQGNFWMQAKIEGYKQALVENDCPVDESLIFSIPQAGKDCKSAVETMVKKGVKACYSSVGGICLSLCDELSKQGLSSPQDMSIAFMSNHMIAVAHRNPYSLTGIMVDRQAVGRQGVLSLIEMVQGNVRKRVIAEIEYKLHKETSCGCAQ